MQALTKQEIEEYRTTLEQSGFTNIELITGGMGEVFAVIGHNEQMYLCMAPSAGGYVKGSNHQ